MTHWRHLRVQVGVESRVVYVLRISKADISVYGGKFRRKNSYPIDGKHLVNEQWWLLNSTLFFYFVFVKCIFVLHWLVTQRNTTYSSACWGKTSCQVIPDLAESFSLVFRQFVSARQTTLRTVNTCANVFVLPLAMIVTIGQISFFGWNSYIPRTLLL